MPSARCQGTGDAGCSRRVFLGSLSMAVRASLVMMVLSACAACAPTGQQAAPQRVPAPAVTRPWVPPVQNRVTDYPSPGPGWVSVGLTDTTIHWFHLPSRRQTGDIVQVWEIVNYAQRNRHGGLSMRTQSEFRCTQRLNRMLNVSEYTDVNARGVMTGYETNSSSQWRAIAPGTAGEAIMNAACQR